MYDTEFYFQIFASFLFSGSVKELRIRYGTLGYNCNSKIGGVGVEMISLHKG